MQTKPIQIAPQIMRVILYVKDVAGTAAFYERHFGMQRLPGALEGWIELSAGNGGCTVALHKASVKQRSGAAMKLVFGVADVDGFKRAKELEGLRFGVVHRLAEHEFSNAKDPAGNSIQISSRGLKKASSE